MSALDSTTVARSRPRTVLVVAAVVLAVLVNLLVYGIGRLAGGSFGFTGPTGAPMEVDAVTVAGFTALPFAVGLTLAAVLGRRWRQVLLVALVLAPTLALVTIAVMTLPADLDATSTLSLAMCHVVLAVISVLALLRLRRLETRPAG